MKLRWKILIACVSSGLTGGLAYASSQLPVWSGVFWPITIAITAASNILIGWPPRTEVK